jgi:hypothetical protein
LRFYQITITDPAATTSETTSAAPVAQYTSLLPNGQPNMSALQVEMDMTIADYLIPNGAWLRIWGIPITTIANASRFNGMSISISGGMSKGLPLATAAVPNQGPLLVGTIFQCFGNWLGTAMTIDFNINPLTSGFKNNAPANLVLFWQKGQTLGAAITAMFNLAYPGVPVDVSSLDPRLVATYTDQAFFQTTAQFAQWLYSSSRGLLGGSYGGARVAVQNGKIRVFDGTTQTAPKQIKFTDLIGQITLLDPATINMNCVMRGDLAIGDYIKLPPGQVTTTSTSYSQFRQGSIYTGVYQITGLRHVGNSRQPGAESWITVVTATGPVPPANVNT